MDRTLARKISQEAEVALKAIADKHGLTVKWKGGSIVDTSAVLKFEFSDMTPEGLVLNKDAVAFLDNCERWGFTEDDLGREFDYAGEKRKIVGLRPRSPKYPIIVECADGKVVKMPLGMVKICLGHLSPEKVRISTGVDDVHHK